MFGSETTNEKTTRGEYVDSAEAGMRSGYNLSEEPWQAVANRPFMAGSYTWTGFDYKGEPNPYGWPDVSNHTGLLDSCGFPKDKAYYFQSCWSDQPMVHLMPASWNWPGKEGQTIRVIAFSNAKRVELFLNGKSYGAQDMPRNAHVEWQVPYAAGELSANAYIDGKTVATDKVETTGAATHIKLTTDRTILHAGAQDAVVVAVAILDDKDRVVPDADQRITFHVNGGATLLGVGNGNPADHNTDKADHRNTFHGRCVAIVEAGARAGQIEIAATSPHLAAGGIALRAK
jgi:beta-galactosidase